MLLPALHTPAKWLHLEMKELVHISDQLLIQYYSIQSAGLSLCMSTR